MLSLALLRAEFLGPVLKILCNLWSRKLPDAQVVDNSVAAPRDASYVRALRAAGAIGMHWAPHQQGMGLPAAISLIALVWGNSRRPES